MLFHPGPSDDEMNYENVDAMSSQTMLSITCDADEPLVLMGYQAALIVQLSPRITFGNENETLVTLMQVNLSF